MFEVYIAMPSGCMSKAREFKATEEDKARHLIKSWLGEMMCWRGFAATVVLSHREDGVDSPDERFEVCVAA